MGRLIHMCYGKTWATKFGGALAMLILGGKWVITSIITPIQSKIASEPAAINPQGRAIQLISS